MTKQYIASCIVHVFNGIGTRVISRTITVPADDSRKAENMVYELITNEYKGRQHEGLSSIVIKSITEVAEENSHPLWCDKHDHTKRNCPWCEIEQLRNIVEIVLYHHPVVDDPIDYESAYDDLKRQVEAEYEKSPWLEEMES